MAAPVAKRHHHAVPIGVERQKSGDLQPHRRRQDRGGAVLLQRAKRRVLRQTCRIGQDRAGQGRQIMRSVIHQNGRRPARGAKRLQHRIKIRSRSAGSAAARGEAPSAQRAICVAQKADPVGKGGGRALHGAQLAAPRRKINRARRGRVGRAPRRRGAPRISALKPRPHHIAPKTPVPSDHRGNGCA